MLKVEILTPERQVHSSQGEEIIVPTLQGVIGIRQGHLPLIAPLKAGVVIVKKEGGEPEFLAVAGGFVEVLPDGVRILADSAERAEEIDEKSIREAMRRAEQAKVEAADQKEFSEALALIEHNLARLKVVQRKRSHGSHSSLPSDRNMS